jgi:cysteine desulfurase
LDRRGGTENAPGIVGFGVAAEAAAAWLAEAGERARLASLRDSFERAILEAIPTASVNGARAERLWNTTNIAFPPLEAEPLLMLLSERPEGEAVNASAGAACSSGSLDPSPVLLAMGVPEREAHGSLRFSMSRFTEERALEAGVATIAECVHRLARSATSVSG